VVNYLKSDLCNRSIQYLYQFGKWATTIWSRDVPRYSNR